MNLSRRTLAAGFAGLALTLPFAAAAQSGWPGKPVKVIVPFATGSTTDIIARAISDKMAQSLGHPVVVENSGPPRWS